jgi:choline dehydrogenase-like flavoprotein
MRVVAAKSVVLAAGTIATTAIVLRSLALVDHPVRLLSNPTAAFLLVLPERIGSFVSSGQNLAQLSLSLSGISEFGNVHCALFSATHIPSYEFVRHFPLSRALAIDLWRLMMPAAIVGNCFLPGDHSEHSITLESNGRLIVRGGARPNLERTLKMLRRALSRTFRPLGALMLPGGFLAGAPGSDIHYAGTLPMTRESGVATTSPDGEVTGLSGVFVADAASFPSLPAKPHTLTIMANADRIGRKLVSRLETGEHGASLPRPLAAGRGTISTI